MSKTYLFIEAKLWKREAAASIKLNGKQKHTVQQQTYINSPEGTVFC